LTTYGFAYLANRGLGSHGSEVTDNQIPNKPWRVRQCSLGVP
jgi:hypothetical protein